MRNILKRTLGRGPEDQKGFTLIELLVVVGIIVALAAVVVPLVIQFAGKGDEGAKAAEANTVQAAVDTLMADQNWLTVTVNGTAAKIDATSDFGTATSTQNLTAYLREASTVYCYTWAATGLVTEVTCP